VVKAKHKLTGTICAIKMISGALEHPLKFKSAMREIQILRQFTRMRGNIFTNKLYDVIADPILLNVFLIINFFEYDLSKL
jgi:serine/threonine protein kinase